MYSDQTDRIYRRIRHKGTVVGQPPVALMQRLQPFTFPNSTTEGGPTAEFAFLLSILWWRAFEKTVFLNIACLLPFNYEAL